MRARDAAELQIGHNLRIGRTRNGFHRTAGGMAGGDNAGYLMQLQRHAGNKAVTDMIRSAGSSVGEVQVSRMVPRGKLGSRFNKMNLTIEVGPRREYNGAIPQNYRLGTYSQLSIATDDYGMDVSMQWESSTGQLRDLETVRSAESVDPKKATGKLAGLGTRTSTWGQIRTSHGYAPDRHGFPKSFATGPGTSVTHQLYLYKTILSEGERVAPNSGFKIKRFIETDPKRTGALQVRTEKKGADVTVGEHSASAGAGEAQVIEEVPLAAAEEKITTS